jgi:hypothetical protein
MAVLDGVQQVGLAGPLVAKYGNDLRVRRGVVAIQVHDAEKLVPFAGEQFRHVIAGTDLVVGIAGEIISERVAGPAQHFLGSFRQRSFRSGN